MELLLVQSRRARLAALCIARPLQRKEHHASGTPRRRPTCAARARGGDGACKTAALGDALHVMIGNIHDRARTLRGRVPNSPESTTARPRFGQLFVLPSWANENLSSYRSYERTLTMLFLLPSDASG